MELKNRAEMDPRFTWDLTPIFKTEDEWEAMMQATTEQIKTLNSIPGTLGESVESFAKGLGAIYAAMENVEKLYGYAFLRKSGDNGDPKSQEMEARAITLLTALQSAIAFLNPEILAMDAQKLDAFMADDSVKTYRHMVEDVLRGRRYTLDAEREKMLAMLADAAQTPSNIFDMFESVDMTFPTVTGEDGQPETLSHGSFSVFRESKNRAVRKEAFEKYFGEYE